MRRKINLLCFVGLLTISLMTAPCYCGVTATLSPIAHSWPNIAGSVLSLNTYSDPNAPTGYSGPYAKVPEDLNNRTVTQTFSMPADSNGLSLTSIVITVNGTGSDANLPMSLHIFDLNQAWLSFFGDSFYNPWDYSIPRGYDFLSSAAFSYPRNSESNDMFLQFNFDTNNPFDLEAGHIYAFEIWPTRWDNPGWSWLRDAEDNPYTGGSAYRTTPPADFTNLTVTRSASSTGNRDMVMGVYGIPCDGNAYHPMSQDYSTDVPLNTTLTWHAGKWCGPGADSNHMLYLSTSEVAVRQRGTAVRIGRLTDANFPDPYNPSYTPTNLLPDKVYYWRVDEFNNVKQPGYWGRSTYGYWRFKTVSVFVKTPVPMNGAVTKFPPFNGQISWTKGCYAASVNGHQVYFGTNFNDVNNATTATPVIYRGAVSDPCYLLSNLTPDYTPLTSGTTYYWRVDEVNISQSPYLWKGPTWSFTYNDPQPTWGASEKLFLNGPPGTFDGISVKDPSIVYSGGKWHLFYSGVNYYSGATHYSIGYASAASIPELKTATHTRLNSLSSGSLAAPQIFWFEPQGKWYLIYWNSIGQGVKGYFSTNTDINDPNGWTVAADMGFSETYALDFWCISDGNRVYCFYSPQNNTILRRSTTVADFPYNWSAPDVAVSGDWEASHVYKNIADGNYYMMVENVIRWFDLWTASSLGGTWTKIANKWASSDNLVDTREHWTDQVSHGEIIRAGVDEKMEINDINDCKILFQGMLNGTGGGGGGYDDIPYKLGMMWKCHAGPGDIDHNCYCDFVDFAILASQWMQWPGVPSADIAPPGGDRMVDINDLSLLLDYWLVGGEQILAY